MTEDRERALLVILVYITVASYCAAQEASCVTPNGESAKCIPIKSCQVIKDAILTKNASVINFVKQSQCGYEKAPLVCCGSTGYPKPPLVLASAGVINSLQPSKVLTPLVHQLLPNSSNCGLENEHDKILGGTGTDLDEYPWLVLLSYVDENDEDAGFRCGGSLISQRYVLTAAHCIVNIGIYPKFVRLGEWRISTTSDCLNTGECSEPSIDVEIERTVSHPNFRRRTKENDIGLIRMQRNIVYTDFIRPICIPSANSPVAEIGSQLTIAGWGSTGKSPSSDVKQKLDVPLVSQQDCAKRLVKHGQITEFQLCAGGVEGKDSCQGDSGGPLMRTIFTENSSEGMQIFLEGIISWGAGCGIAGFPGVYTRVSKYSTWISNNIEKF